MVNLIEHVQQYANRAKAASRELVLVNGEQKNAWLRKSAELILSNSKTIQTENQKDLDKAEGFGLNAAAIDRLKLTDDRLEGIANALEQIIMLPEPVGEVIESSVRPNGLLVSKVQVPLGVVFFIYESRPNVTVDAAALCIKSGNAVILRGGKEAFHSNHALHSILKQALKETGLPEYAVQLVDTTDREAVGHFLKLNEQIDVTIPRGGKSLIERVASEATMPVIKHFDGICHVYVDQAADLKMAVDIIVNSKCHRPGVCNAAETLLVHSAVAEEFLPLAESALSGQGVSLKACERSSKYLENSEPATEEDFRTEYLDLILSVKIVDSIEEAVNHINEYSSQHTDSIVTGNLKASEYFLNAVDSSAVIVNASTRFNDGGEFGLGAEIGISTDKFHARGPCGLKELTSYKYVVHGNGQIRT
jgi:glutamate-5-semialdehyde dehydrogenase